MVRNRSQGINQEKTKEPEATKQEVEETSKNNGPEMDIGKMMEMAKTFASLMSGGENKDEREVQETIESNQEPQKKNSGEMDIGKMLQMVQMMKTLFPTDMPSIENPRSSEKEDQNRMETQKTWVAKEGISTVFDEMIQTPQLKVIKSAIPYMEIQHQKHMGIMIKCLELKRVMDAYTEENVETIQNTFRGEKNWKTGMLRSIRPHCTKERQYVVDMLLKMFDIGDIMEQMKGMESPAGGASGSVKAATQKKEQGGPNIAQMLKLMEPMLDDKQKQMVNMFSTFMQ